MVSWIKRLAAPIAALALFIAAPVAVQAEDVHYYVTGTFNANVASVAGNFFQTDSLTLGGSTVTFRNNTSGAAIDGGMHLVDYAGLNAFGQPYTNVDFGSFFVSSSTAFPGDSFTGSTFTLNIIQVVPGSGSGSTIATATGSLVGSSGNATGSTLSLVFAPLTLLLPPGNPTVQYDITTNASGAVAIGVGNNDVTTLEGTVTGVPLPGVALAGMALMGCVGGLRKARNRAEEVVTA
jgi:hypothetical protein